MNTAYLIVGGNKGNKKENLLSALQLMENSVGEISRKSKIYVTKAWGNANQPDFLNQVICINTKLSSTDLLKEILLIEEQLGRKRTDERWMERTMDIDILFYNDEIIDEPNLQIPHPYIKERKFVLIPMNEIAAELIHPVYNKSITTLLDECKDELEVSLLNQQTIDK